MDDSDELEERDAVSPVGRKRKACKDNYERGKERNMRHSGAGKNPAVGCSHKAESGSGFCQADKLTQDDIALNFLDFYSSSNKVEQDAKLLHFISVGSVKRRRKQVSEQNCRKDRYVSTKYSLLTNQQTSKLPVCKNTFCSVLGISKDRVARVAKYYAEFSTARPELRGGARKVEKNEGRQNLIEKHIETFTCRASRYGRRGPSGRKYLPSDLCVRKMYELFKAQNHMDLSYSLYYSVFRTKFNLGFGSPASDACPDCANHQLASKDPNLTRDERKAKSGAFIVHWRRAWLFHDLLDNISETAVTVCFDMMQNLVLPKSSISQAYYSRQLYLYVFGIVVHHGRDSTQMKDNVHLYTWLENENKRDNNMIASALEHFLRHKIYERLRQACQLRLFSDSCFGRNMAVLSMLFALRRQEFPDLRITFTFPLSGHSILPVDRMFGRIEQSIRKVETILHPAEYISILKKHGQVHQYAVDWEGLDYQTAAHAFLQDEKSFKLSDSGVLQIVGDKLGVKTGYGGIFCEYSLLKDGKSWGDFSVNPLEKQSTVTVAKKTDVLALLEAIGVPQQIMDFYEQALATVETADGHSIHGDGDDDDDDDNDNAC